MDTNLEDLKHIRSMMERSTKFLSLSGMSGVSAGVCALIGATAAYFVQSKQLSITGSMLYDFILIGVLVLLGAISGGLYFSARKAKKTGAKFWMPVTKQIIKDFGTPMFIGGLYCLVLLYQNYTEIIAATMLIFYGLSLINVGARTYRDIKLLGVCEIILGFSACIFENNDLIFWTLGFGVLHILYGIIMHFKYDSMLDKKG